MDNCYEKERGWLSDSVFSYYAPFELQPPPPLSHTHTHTHPHHVHVHVRTHTANMLRNHVHRDLKRLAGCQAHTD